MLATTQDLGLRVLEHQAKSPLASEEERLIMEVASADVLEPLIRHHDERREDTGYHVEIEESGKEID